MAVPNIMAFRIDERLIHGQGQLWIKSSRREYGYRCK